MTTPSLPSSQDTPPAVFGVQYVANGMLQDRVPMLTLQKAQRLHLDSVYSYMQDTPKGEMLECHVGRA